MANPKSVPMLKVPTVLRGLFGSTFWVSLLGVGHAHLTSKRDLSDLAPLLDHRSGSFVRHCPGRHSRLPQRLPLWYWNCHSGVTNGAVHISIRRVP
ncbi:hypothetical protein CALCODRAFT_500363 [Calocera cornea HHB12733]|uniref:Uncharacterized protein n=1 Tax=Calocera cornea HHB12733 TaxID=1353952 RepID=A0A165E3N9_9BASI|nr:hypothetical protein CALCODRAFT_500363 [Calocera cornea HHB12733]